MESTSISKSSQGLKEFIEETHLSKKELANMIGVTLSYVYNLANENAPFTRRKDTLERLAVVMGVDPIEFEEYPGGSNINPYYVDNSARAKYLDIRQNYTISNLDLIRKVPPELQLKVVDILRGKDIPPDITFIRMLLKLLDNRISGADCYTILGAAVIDAFEQAGTIFNKENMGMVRTMVDSYIESR